MTTAQAVGAVSREAAEWYAMDWQAINRNVRRLPVRIVQATKASRWGKVRALQRLLIPRNRVSPKEAFEGLELCERNFHARFLEGWTGAIPSGCSVIRPERCQVRRSFPTSRFEDLSELGECCGDWAWTDMRAVLHDARPG